MNFFTNHHLIFFDSIHFYLKKICHKKDLITSLIIKFIVVQSAFKEVAQMKVAVLSVALSLP